MHSQECFHNVVKEFDLNCIYDSVGRDELKRFFYNDFIGVVGSMIRSTEKQLDINIPNEFRSFLCDFYTEGIAGMLINLFQNPDKYIKTDLLKYLSVIINNSIPAAILNKTVV